jgi:hypothetical protein
MRISFLAPRLPPAVCGVADHTCHLADALIGQGGEVGFIHREPLANESESFPGPVCRWEGGTNALVDCVGRQEADWLWVQFTNYDYSRWGAPYRFGYELRRFRRQMPNVHVALCLHETHCLPRQLGFKGPILSPWQKYTVGAVARLADVIFVSVPLYYRRAVDDYCVSSDRVVRLPIGSNIPPAELSTDERSQTRRDLGWSDSDIVGLVFGSYATQLRALRRSRELVEKGLSGGILTRVVCLGGDGTTVPSELSGWRNRLGGQQKVEILGPRPAQEIGRIMSSCDFAFAATPRHVLEKSGAFIACAFAGLAVLVYPAPSAPDIANEELPVLDAESWDWKRARSPEVIAIRAALKNRAESSYRWESIARRALSAMTGVERPFTNAVETPESVR